MIKLVELDKDMVKRAAQNTQARYDEKRESRDVQNEIHGWD